MEIKKLVPRGFLTVCILKQLQTGPKHGYDIMKTIKETGWEPSPGAIYPTLHQLKEKGLIIEVESEEEKRIYYKLTNDGKIIARKIEKDSEEMKKRFQNFIMTMSQIFEINEAELKSLMKVHEKFRKDLFLLLPLEIKETLKKSRILILKIAKDKLKQKKLEKIIKEFYKKLGKLDGE